MRPDRINIQVVAGDAYTHIYDYVDEDTGDPIDLTGETISYTIYVRLEEELVLTSGSGLTITAAIGRITAALTAAQTETLRGRGDVRYVLRLDDEERTIAIGDIGVYVTP